jgi:hypothetical protein
VARHIFQVCPVWIYTLRVTSQTSESNLYGIPVNKMTKISWEDILPNISWRIFSNTEDKDRLSEANLSTLLGAREINHGTYLLSLLRKVV